MSEPKSDPPDPQAKPIRCRITGAGGEAGTPGRNGRNGWLCIEVLDDEAAPVEKSESPTGCKS